MSKQVSPGAVPSRLSAVPGRVTRLERTVALLDHCSAAKVLADELGDKFLSYMLSMVLEEARDSLSYGSMAAQGHKRGSPPDARPHAGQRASR